MNQVAKGGCERVDVEVVMVSRSGRRDEVVASLPRHIADQMERGLVATEKRVAA